MSARPLPSFPRARPSWCRPPRPGQLVAPTPTARAPEENSAAQTRLRWLGFVTLPDPEEAGP